MSVKLRRRADRVPGGGLETLSCLCLARPDGAHERGSLLFCGARQGAVDLCERPAAAGGFLPCQGHTIKDGGGSGLGWPCPGVRGRRGGVGAPALLCGAVGVWRGLLQVTAQLQTVFLVYVNRVGCEDGLTFGGGSMVVDPLGRIVDELPPLEEGLLVSDLDAGALRRARATYPLLRDSRLELVHRELERIRRGRYELPDEPGEPPQEPGRAVRTPESRDEGAAG